MAKKQHPKAQKPKPSITKLALKLKHSIEKVRVKKVRVKKVRDTPPMKRPNFSPLKIEASRIEAELATGRTDLMDANLANLDLAAPHRAPYAAIRDHVFYKPRNEVERMVNALIEGSKITEEKTFPAFRKQQISASRTDLLEKLDRLIYIYGRTRENVEAALKSYTLLPNQLTKKKLVTALNNLASNAPGLGPHSTSNLLVSDNIHINPGTPRSLKALIALPYHPVAIAYVALGDMVVTPAGAVAKSTDLDQSRARTIITNYKYKSHTTFYGSISI